ncbi:MAG TPA: MmgE/PrpD family protein [Gryllotalpicola sp.]
MSTVVEEDVAVRPVTRELADFIAGFRYEDLPPEVVEMAKRSILDSLACGVYGSRTPWVEAVVRTVAQWGEAKVASAWGLEVRAGYLGAAMINGTAAQGYELDDCHDQSMSHYGAGVIPTVLALAEAFGPFTGKQLITAVVAGYEVGTRVGNTVSPSMFHRGFHPCGPTSTFGSAAATAKLLGLDAEQTLHAIALAGSSAAGLMAAQFGAMAKRFHSGKAAMNGIIAALSAREGLTGIRDVLEAPYGGFCSTYAAEYDLDYAVKGLGQHWEILRNGFKQYSSLASSHTTVDALRAIMKNHGVTAEDVEHVHVETTEMVKVHCGWPYVYNGETIQAQMNMFFTGATTLIDGTAFIDGYTDERLNDPRVVELANRFDCVVAPDLDALGKDEMRAVRVTVTTKAGESYTESVTYRSGHWKNPITDEDLSAKFHNLAERIITADAANTIESVVKDLENQQNPAPVLAVQLQTLKD